jgi:hypothetical protein
MCKSDYWCKACRCQCYGGYQGSAPPVLMRISSVRDAIAHGQGSVADVVPAEGDGKRYSSGLGSRVVA